MVEAPGKNELLEGLLASMEDLDDSNPRLLAMLYGNSGVGKTVLAVILAKAICPKDKEILYLDYKDGFSTLMNPRWAHLRPGVKRMRYRGYSQIDTLTMALTAISPPPPFDKVGVVILDESSSMADNDLLLVTRARATKDPTKDPDEPKQPDMNAATQRAKRTFSGLHGAPVHVIHVSHVREDKDNLNIVVQSPAFMPKLSKSLREELNIVGMVTADEKEVTDGPNEYVRYVQVAPTRRIVAKSRIDGLGERIQFDELKDKVVEFVNGKRGATKVDNLEVEDLDTQDEDSESTFVGIEVD